MRFRSTILAAALALLFAAAPPPWNARPLAAAELQAAKLEVLEFVTKGGVRSFAVELAVTPAELDRGLMFRRELPEGRGMLFDFKIDRPVTMWMKNTPLSLDMIFIRSDGTVVRIAERTTPESLATISSGVPVRAVLEVIAGTAKKLGIAPGDRAVHPIFGKR